MSWAKVAGYKKAVGAFVGGLAGVWAVVLAADWSSKDGAVASIVPIVAAVVTYFSPKNVEV
jgi:hypothetical protein